MSEKQRYTIDAARVEREQIIICANDAEEAARMALFALGDGGEPFAIEAIVDENGDDCELCPECGVLRYCEGQCPGDVAYQRGYQAGYDRAAEEYSQ